MKAKIQRAMTRLRKRIEISCHRNELPFSPNTLGGACGISSFLVFRILKKMGFRPVFHINPDHCFVTVAAHKKYWVDLTLTQFASTAGDVFIEPRRFNSRVHRSNRRATRVADIRKLFNRWPDEQNPFKQKLPKITI